MSNLTCMHTYYMMTHIYIHIHTHIYIQYTDIHMHRSMHMHTSVCDYTSYSGFPGGSVVKNPPASAEDAGSIPGREDPPEKEIKTHSSILPWRIPWTEEPGRLQSMRLQRVRHNLATKQPHFLFISSDTTARDVSGRKKSIFCGSNSFSNPNICKFSSVTQLYPSLCDPMNCSMPGLPVHHQLLEFTQTHVH